MTRGQIAVIVKWLDGTKVLTSTEFNGDMYLPTKGWAGHGTRVINALRRTYDVATYQYEVAKFNKDNHHYNDCESLTFEKSIETLNFTKNYFDNWFSDYVYIKNLTNESVTLKTNIVDGMGRDIGTKEVRLEPKQIAVLTFGTLLKITQ